ncbi:MAG: aldo/keto reductase, partial [Clostridia bacterium]
DSRAGGSSRFLTAEQVTPERIEMARALQQVAIARGQTLAQMALAWVLRQSVLTSVVVGASRLSQIEEDVRTVQKNPPFTVDELAAIDRIVGRKVTR